MPDPTDPTQINDQNQPASQPTRPVVEEVNPLSTQSDPFPPVESTTDTPTEPPLGPIPPIVTSPKKNITKKIVATVLGLLVLVGGLAAGLVLVRQQQEVREQAVGQPPGGGPCKICTASAECVQGDPLATCDSSINECAVPSDCLTGGICPKGFDEYYCPDTGETRCSRTAVPGCVKSGQQLPGEDGTGGLQACGVGLQCRANPFQGADACIAGGTRTEYCCNPGEVIKLSGGSENCATPDGGTTDDGGGDGGGGGGGTTNFVDCTALCGNQSLCTQACNQYLPGENCSSLCANQSQCVSRCQSLTGGGTIQVGTDCAATQGEGTVYLYGQTNAEIRDYWCPNVTSLGNGCAENESSRGVRPPGTYTVNTSGKCGIFQIDVFANGVPVLGCGSYKYVPCVGTPPPESAKCLNIQAFDTNWTKITDLSTLKAGDKVRFTVAGQASSGTFDRARFKINGVQRAEVSAKRPGTQEFYDEYTIPAGVTSFSVNAEVHHSSLGWF